MKAIILSKEQEKQLRDWDDETVKAAIKEIDALRIALTSKDSEVERLTREFHNLKFRNLRKGRRT